MVPIVKRVCEEWEEEGEQFCDSSTVHTSYLSKTISEELIVLLAEKTFDVIINEVKTKAANLDYLNLDLDYF